MRFAEKSLNVRHWCLRQLCKVVAPTVANLIDRKYRPAIGAVKEKFGDNQVIGAEIGVAEGENAEWILNTLNIKRLYLIDPYKPYYDMNVLCTRYVDTLELACKRLKKYGRRPILFFMSSDDAVQRIFDSLHFVYIDGDHNYDQCFADIVNYSQLVQKGGIVGGHNFDEGYPTVIKAVLDHCMKHNLKFHHVKEDWWFVKE